MSNAQQIINEIDVMLDKFMLKNNKMTTQELIDFIEEKWSEADEEKYHIHQGSIIIGRMLNEYASIGDLANTKRWLDMMDKHDLSKKEPMYINNHYNGLTMLECGSEEEALPFLLASYKENPEYINSMAPACVELLSKHIDLPKKVAAPVKEKEPYIGYIELAAWKDFFKEELNDLYFDLGGEVPGYRMSKKHKIGLSYLQENQAKILDVILTELLRQYPQMQTLYGYEGDEKADFMPDVKNIDGFAALLSPLAIHIMSVYQGDQPYIGYEFSCSWDSEHGLGVMMFKDRIVEMEGADCSFLNWIAKADLKNSKKL